MTTSRMFGPTCKITQRGEDVEKNARLELDILQELSEDGYQTQRSLAKKLNIALGLTNTYVKRLVNKGCIMVRRMPNNRIFYNLTPQGIYEKAQLTLEFMRYSIDYYKDLRAKIGRTYAALEAAGVRRVAFYGVGEVAEIAYISLQESALELVAVADEERAGERFLGRPVVAPRELAAIDPERVIITDIRPREELAGAMMRVGLPDDRFVLFSGQELKLVHEVEFIE